MAVNLTRIYTRLGDDGMTHLGDRSPRAEDGFPRRRVRHGRRAERPHRARRSADRHAAPVSRDASPGSKRPVRRPRRPFGAAGRRKGALAHRSEHVAWLEQRCDELNEQLTPLKSFLLPGGLPASSALHLCRTVCRRAERRVLVIGPDVNGQTACYLNRLSDLLFILSQPRPAARKRSGARRLNADRGEVALFIAAMCFG